MNKNILEVINYAISTKRFVGGLGYLKRDGSIKKINGQVFKLYESKKTHQMIILVDNFLGNTRKHTDKRWQLILLDNLIQLNENGWQHRKAA